MARMAPEPQVEDSGAVMSFGDHLEALRRCLIRATVGVLLISCLTIYYGRDLVAWLCQPLIESQRQLGLPQQTINLTVAGGFMVYVKVSLIAGLVIGSPWVVYQLWRFVRPGLHSDERRYFVILGPFSAGLSALAVLFLYYLFLPAAISFLLMFSVNFPPAAAESPSSLRTVTGFFNKVNSYFVPGSLSGIVPENPVENRSGGTPGITTQPDARAATSSIAVLDHDPEHPAEGQVWINKASAQMRTVFGGQVHVIQLAPNSLLMPQIEINEYLNMVVLMGLILVVSFQLPVGMAIGAAVGLLRPKTLAKYRKYVVFGCFVIGVVCTPNQDVVSNVVFPLLLWGLFEVGLVLMRILGRKESAESGA
jgi:Sec-independent protein secretion pathway component TatC